MILSYDCSVTVDGKCRPDTLREEIRQGVYPGNPSNVVGVTVDAFERQGGEEVEVEYVVSPTEDEALAIDGVFLDHDSTKAPPE